jgi:3-oxoacyl-[acyl-carrier protein] reductase
VLGVILDGAFLTVRAALKHLRASDAGAIVNIGGLSGHAGARTL